MKITDESGMGADELKKSKKIVRGIIKDNFSKKELKELNKADVNIDIKELPEDIAGQSVENEVYLDPDTLRRADGVTEDVVVHELTHAQNRIRETKNPGVYLRKESFSNKPEDVSTDILVEEAVTEAITAAKLQEFDERTETPVAVEPGDLNKRYNRHLTGHLGGDWLKHSHVHSHFDKNEEWKSQPGHEHEHDPIYPENRKKKKFRGGATRTPPIIRPEGTQQRRRRRYGYQYRNFDGKYYVNFNYESLDRNTARMRAAMLRRRHGLGVRSVRMKNGRYRNFIYFPQKELRR